MGFPILVRWHLHIESDDNKRFRSAYTRLLAIKGCPIVKLTETFFVPYTYPALCIFNLFNTNIMWPAVYIIDIHISSTFVLGKVRHWVWYMFCEWTCVYLISGFLSYKNTVSEDLRCKAVWCSILLIACVLSQLLASFASIPIVIQLEVIKCAVKLN